MKSLYKLGRRFRSWYDELDHHDDDYFGYGDDWSVFWRRICRPVKRGFNTFLHRVQSDPSAARKTEPMQYPSHLKEKPVDSPHDSRQEVSEDYFYLPFALPDEVRVAEVHLDTPQPLRLPTAVSRPIPKALPYEGQSARATQIPIGRWTPLAAGLAVGIAAMQLFVVSPLTRQIKALSQSQTGSETPSHRVNSLEQEVQQLRETLAALQSKPVVAQTQFPSEQDPAPSLKDPRDNPVPDPYATLPR